jgi:hypothetical protein
MARNSFQEVKIHHHEPENNRDKRDEKKSEFQKDSVNSFNGDTRFVSNHSIIEKKPKYRLWVVASASLVFLFFALSFFFTGAKVIVTPKVKNITLSEDFNATKDSPAAPISFNLIAISGSEDTKVPTTSVKSFTDKATGSVLLYNSFTTTPQTLAPNTRLEGTNHKIYFLKNKTTIPGMNSGTPGKVEASIVASAVGEEYNSDPMDFKIPGFKGTSKYTMIYARSSNDITGGKAGDYAVLTDADQSTAAALLKSTLEEKLQQQAQGQIPPGFILFKDASFLVLTKTQVDPFAPVRQSADGVPMHIEGTLYGFLFNEKNISREIANKVIDNYDESVSPVHIPDVKSLSFTLPDAASTSFADVSDIRFHLSGAIKVVWDVDAAKLAKDLLGKSKKNFNIVLQTFASVDSAELVLHPIWAFSLPSKEKNIAITVKDVK